ncbi:hypothetical protein P0G11_13325, partial [Adlercreutzia rubneri]
SEAFTYVLLGSGDQFLHWRHFHVECCVAELEISLPIRLLMGGIHFVAPDIEAGEAQFELCSHEVLCHDASRFVGSAARRPAYVGNDA